MQKKKKLLSVLLAVLTFCCLLTTAALAADDTSGVGDVAGAVEDTWKAASGQIKDVVNKVVFPVIDTILAIFFFAKLGMSYFDYKNNRQFDWTGPAILFACLVFMITAPSYVWSIIGI